MKSKFVFPQFEKLSDELIAAALSQQGVYLLLRIDSGFEGEREYVGQTSKRWFAQRLEMHLNALGRGNHHCERLQADWNLEGSLFSYQLLETCDPSECLERERHYIELLNPYYNASNNSRCQVQGGVSMWLQ